ncbi:tryptophan 2,3-dioxygenase B-like [Ciona intestinalis]
MSCPFLSNAQQEKQANGEAHAKVTYPGQLQLASILNSQHLISDQPGNTPVHDEHLFIVTHQAFELWFKQIIFELNSIREIFDQKLVEDSALPVACERLERITKIFNVLIAQFEVISTMAPQEFGELRPSLGDSSGYQSCQYRLIEVKLGVRDDLRIKYSNQSYQDTFEGMELESLKTSQNESSLFDAIDQWLARTPGLETDGFNFIGKFKVALEKMIEDGEDKTKVRYSRLIYCKALLQSLSTVGSAPFSNLKRLWVQGLPLLHKVTYVVTCKWHEVYEKISVIQT